VLLEEGARVGLPLLPPMMHDDLVTMKLDQVQFTPPDNEPDDPLPVGGVERHQALTGTFEDRLPCVRQRPGHGIIDRPGFP
jgi:hypothetical protein